MPNLSNTPPSIPNLGADARAVNAHRESHDAYEGLILQLCDRWRVIICRHWMQFILQKRSSTTNTGVWLGKSFCTTREALIDVCSRLKLISGESDRKMLDVLPNRAHRRRRRARVLRVPRFFSAGAVADARGCAGAAQRVRADVRRARIARPDHRRPATRPQRRRGAVRVRYAALVRRPARRSHRRSAGRRPQRRVVVLLRNKRSSPD